MKKKSMPWVQKICKKWLKSTLMKTTFWVFWCLKRI